MLATIAPRAVRWRSWNACTRPHRNLDRRPRRGAAAQAQELAAELEELGYGAIWLPEVAGRDVMVHLALLLSATQRLVGATGIASIWARDAVTMTASVKGLTEAFPERVLLGLG